MSSSWSALIFSAEIDSFTKLLSHTRKDSIILVKVALNCKLNVTIISLDISLIPQ